MEYVVNGIPATIIVPFIATSGVRFSSKSGNWTFAVQSYMKFMVCVVFIAFVKLFWAGLAKRKSL